MLGKAYRSFHHRTIALLFLVHGFFGLDKGDTNHGAIKRVSTIALVKISTSENKIKLICVGVPPLPPAPQKRIEPFVSALFNDLFSFRPLQGKGRCSKLKKANAGTDVTQHAGI